MLKRSDEARFSDEPLQHLKMVVDEWGVLDSNSLIYSFVAVCIVIERLPHKVTLLNALRLLRELLPVTTSDQSLGHSLRVVSSMDIE